MNRLEKTMKNSKVGIKCLSIAVIFVLIGGLASCDQNNNSDSSDGISDSSSSSSLPSEDSSSSSQQDEGSLWDDEQKALLKKYCGEVLPYPSDMFVGKVSVNEIYDYEYGYSYLEIYDEATEFTLKDYNKTLKANGWNAISSYNGFIIQSDTSGTSFVELTKGSEDGDNGYDIIYFFNNPYNVIHCYGGLSARATSEISWSDADKDAIKKVTTIDLPFIALGESYSVSATNINTLQMYDVYVENLTEKYAKMLIDAGFVKSGPLSSMNDVYYLVKNLGDGNSLTAVLYYYGGNNFSFYFSATPTSYFSWPSELTDEIKDKSGVEIPHFEIAEGGTYLAYKKNDSYFIYTYDLLNGYNYETYNLNVLRNPSLSWEETVNFITYNLTDDNGTTVGFMIIVNVVSPTSTFVSSWPSDKIDGVISSLLNIKDVSLPSFDSSSFPDTGKQIKYSIRGQEYYDQYFDFYYSEIKEEPTYYGLEKDASDETIRAEASRLARLEEGILVSVFDVELKAYNSYEQALYNAGWYRFIDNYNQVTYEDPEGKLAITLDSYQDPSHDNEGVTTFFFHPGSEKKHSPEFRFVVDETNVAIGHETYLELVKNMYPYDVTYSSNDATGKISVDDKGYVKVDDSVKEGTTATITASITLPSGETITTECVVTAIKVTSYTPAEVIDNINSLISEAGFKGNVVHNDKIDSVTVDFGKSASVSEIKELVETKFSLSDFEKYESGWDKVSDYVDDKKIDGSRLRYNFLNKYCSILVEYFIYTINGATYLRVIAL